MSQDLGTVAPGHTILGCLHGASSYESTHFSWLQPLDYPPLNLLCSPHERHMGYQGLRPEKVLRWGMAGRVANVVRQEVTGAALLVRSGRLPCG